MNWITGQNVDAQGIGKLIPSILIIEKALKSQTSPSENCLWGKWSVESVWCFRYWEREREGLKILFWTADGKRERLVRIKYITYIRIIYGGRPEIRGGKWSTHYCLVSHLTLTRDNIFCETSFSAHADGSDGIMLRVRLVEFTWRLVGKRELREKRIIIRWNCNLMNNVGNWNYSVCYAGIWV